MSKKAGVDKETRRVALLVSGLITTPADELEDYRKKRLGRGSAIPLDHLGRARAVLIAVAAAIHSDSDDDVARLDELHRLVVKGKPAAPVTAARAEPPPKAPAGDADEAGHGPDDGADHEVAEKAGPASDAGPPAAEPPDTERADAPAPPPRVGEDIPPIAPPLASSPPPVTHKDAASPWANPAAALTAARPSPSASTPSLATPAPSTVPKPPDPAPPAPVVAPDSDAGETERPASSEPPTDAEPAEPKRYPLAGETQAPPASVTAEAGLEFPKNPALPFVGAPREADPDASAPGAGGSDWALPFTSWATPPPGDAVEAKVRAAPPRFPRAEPDDDEPTMASINLEPAAPSSSAGASDPGASDPASSDPGAEDDTHPAAIGGAALAHMTIPKSSLTLTDYAALCAICGAFPAHLSDTYLRFGLSDHTERYALDEAWHARFAEQPEAQVVWKSLFTQFRAWLTQYGRL